MEKADIWMPLYIGDYLGDTMHLTTEEHGAYLLLLMAYWKNGGPLDADDTHLMGITRLSKHKYKKLKATVFEKYFSIYCGKICHKRADAEIARAKENKSQATEKARKAAEARWSKHRGEPDAQAMLEQCPSPSPSPVGSLSGERIPLVDINTGEISAWGGGE